MKIAVYGGSGATGRLLLEQATERGWQVAAPVRRSISDPVPGVAYLVGDPLGADKIRSATESCDGVLSVLGFRRRLRGPAATTVYSRSAAQFAATLEPGSRLVFCTSAGVELHDPHELWPYRHIVKPLWLDGGYDDMRRAESILRASALSWVIVRPGRLTDGPATDRLRVSPRYRPPHANSVSRADLARFMLDQVVSEQWVKATPTLGTPRGRVLPLTTR